MSDNVPGFSAEQTWALRRLIREEVHEGIKLALADPNCPRPCDKVADLELNVYGNGSAGLKGRMTALEEQVSGLVWLSRTTLAAAIVAVVGVIAQALR